MKEEEMSRVIRGFVIIQSVCVLIIIFFVRFFDYLVANEVTAVFKPLVSVAMLVTIILSLLISLAGHLLAHKAWKGSLVPIWINLFTVFMLFLPIKEWGIKFNFDMHYEQRNRIVDEYRDEKIDEEIYTIMPQVKGDLMQIALNNQVLIVGREGKLYFFFALYDGILGLQEGFICVVDTPFQPIEAPVQINQYYQIRENWYFGSVYNSDYIND